MQQASSHPHPLRSGIPSPDPSPPGCSKLQWAYTQSLRSSLQDRMSGASNLRIRLASHGTAMLIRRAQMGIIVLPPRIPPE